MHPLLAAPDWHFLFPRKKWQVYLTPPNVNKLNSGIDPTQLSDVASWLAHNPEYEYILVGVEGAQALALQQFKKNPTLVRMIKELKNTAMKSDLLRYLILSIEGGVYADIDTVNLKFIGQWVPEKYWKDTRVVIGVEFDRLDGPNWGEVHPDLQFCQWAIAASPGHALFSSMVESVISEPELTGPAAWTDIAFRQLQQYEPDITSLRNFSGLTEPSLVGDILILPIDGFGMGRPRSNSTNDGSVPSMLYNG